ncbi:MAG: super-infection exclusion protein B [Bacillota bacterium]|nr:super-infection exclusion protein B [Bacillota bacterium]
MNFDITKLLSLSARTLGAISIACAFLLFFLATILPFSISEFRKDNGIWLFIILVVSIAIWVSYFIKWITDSTKEKIKTHKTWKTYKYVLNNLSDDEKLF